MFGKIPMLLTRKSLDKILVSNQSRNISKSNFIRSSSTNEEITLQDVKKIHGESASIYTQYINQAVEKKVGNATTEIESKISLATEAKLKITNGAIKKIAEDLGKKLENIKYVLVGSVIAVVGAITVNNFIQMKRNAKKVEEQEKDIKKALEEYNKKINENTRIALIKPLESTFKDFNENIDYDKKIEEAREEIKQACDPCEAKDKVVNLVNELNNIKKTYHSRPCREGYCFGIFTPHKDRISKRINSISEESKTYENNCQIFQRLNIS